MKAMSSITSYLSVNCPKTALHMEYVKYFHASVSEFLALSRIWAPNGIIIEYCRDGFLRNIYVRVRIFRISVVLIYVNHCVTGHQHLHTCWFSMNVSITPTIKYPIWIHKTFHSKSNVMTTSVHFDFQISNHEKFTTIDSKVQEWLWFLLFIRTYMR